MMKRFLLAVLPVLLVSCSGSLSQEGASGVSLSLEPGSPDPGDSVTLVLENGSDAEIGYNLCPSSLTRQAGSDWTVVPSDRMCTMELRMLQPGGTDRFTLQLPDDLKPGTYRFQTIVERTTGGGLETLVTEAFEIQAP